MSTDKVDAREASAAYDKIDRYLRNNLDDDDYAEYSAALDLVSTQPEGYVLVPVEPTDAMLEAAFNAPARGHPETATSSFTDIYSAMIAAAQEGK